jgi:hypothetical protein
MAVANRCTSRNFVLLSKTGEHLRQDNQLSDDGESCLYNKLSVSTAKPASPVHGRELLNYVTLLQLTSFML